MSLADIVNALFEAFGFFAVAMSCIRVLKDKKVAGVSILTVTFFTSWGVWNLYYYPSLGQTFSGVAAGLTCLANLTWCGLLLKYGGQE